MDHFMKMFRSLFHALLIITLPEALILNIRASELPDEPDKSVKIGLLIPDNNSMAAKQGAEMAIRMANDREGLNGLHFQVVVRSMEGPWGTGSRQAVNLIFEEKVWAILGSHDGRNAHLAEQAATKANVVFVSAWAGDPTLSQAFVPWFFNCLPNDLQQARSLAEEIYEKKKIDKVVIVVDNEYDSKQAFNNFLKVTRLKGKSDPSQLLYETYSQNLNELSDRIKLTEADCIILFCKAPVSLKIYRQVRLKTMNQPVFGPLFLLNENELSYNELQYYNNDLLIPSGKWPDSKSSGFIKEFTKLYGKAPGIVAAYAFDGMNVLIESIRIAGSPDHEKIQKALSGILYEGVTGPIRFDNRGNRTGTYDLMSVKNGLPLSDGKY